MHLSDSEMKDREQWEKAGIRLPGFDREAMRQAKHGNWPGESSPPGRRGI